MKTFLPAVLIMGLATLGFSENSDEADVRAAHEAYVKAAKAGDRSALEKLFSNDLQYSHSNAKLENKQEAVDGLVKAPGNFEVHSQVVHVYSKAATIRAKVTAHGATGDIPLTILMVWRKNGKDWQLVERHTTRIPA